MTPTSRGGSAPSARRDAAEAWATPTHPVTCERHVAMHLSDGTRLTADVYLPAGKPGPWPVLLERTPYNKLGAALVLSAKYFAGHGYAVVLQDVRGRFESEGEFYPFGNEGPDGVETLAWVRAQLSYEPRDPALFRAALTHRRDRKSTRLNSSHV